MSTGAIDLHVLGASARSAVSTRAQMGLADWAQGWLPQPGLIETMLVRPDVVAADPRPCFDRIDGPWGAMWISRLTSDWSAFAKAVLGAEFLDAHGQPADEWLARAAREAWVARDEALGKALVGGFERTRQQKLPTSLHSFGCGAMELACEAVGLLVVLDRGVLRHVPPREVPVAGRAAPTSLEQVLPDAHLRLSVALGSVELEVSRLFDLREGDVLRLPTRLDHDLVVECEERPFAHGLLGVRDGRRAIQIV